MPSPLPPSLWSDPARRIGAAIALVVVAGIGIGAGYLIWGGSDNGGDAPAPTSVVIDKKGQPSAAETGGFPEFATRNTTRIGGADPTADAASVALATYPTQGGVGAAGAATIVPADDWQASIAASPLTADPIATPILLSGTEVPAPTAAALTALSPQGLDDADGTQAFAVGDVAVPEGLKTTSFTGSDPADLADEIDQERAKITGEKDPQHLLVVSSSDSSLAMPAAAWAARSGDPILFADGNNVPEGTMNVIKRHPNTPVFVLGPASAISDGALKKLGSATRIGAEDPVENAIEFAKFTNGTFGWNINDPGHGFTIASIDRPLDAAAAAPLASTGGSPGPLLVPDDSATVPPALQSFLSDTQPGFEDDPTRAVFNHVWIIGNPDAISVPFQVQVDQLTKLAPVSGSKTPPDFVLPETGGTKTTPDNTSTTPKDSTKPSGDTTTPSGDLPEPTFNIDPNALDDLGK
jgi:hypothetical protein